MDDNVGIFYIEDGETKSKEQKPGLHPNDGVLIYDVIRLIDGVPLFFEDHYERTLQSFQAMGSECSLTAGEMLEYMERLARLNDNQNCNIKFIMFTSQGQPKSIAYMSKYYYPTDQERDKGAAVGLYSLERDNPNVKLVDFDYRRKINEIKEERGFYEVFLIDGEGKINEGGSSNIFFIKSRDRIFTAPEEKVLKGITRMKVIEACNEAGFEVVETAVSAERVDESVAVFLSGTSPKVMPVSSIDDMKFESSDHPMVRSIMTAFDLKIEEYIKERKK